MATIRGGAPSDRTRTRRTGNVMGFGITQSRDDSFEARIGKRITPRSDGCWQWDDGSKEYPIVYPLGARSGVAAHRWIFFLLSRLDPDDWPDHHAHHECRNTNCVNPAHMLLLTPKEHRQRHAEMNTIG